MTNIEEIISKLDAFTQAYLVAALWSSTESDGTPLDDGRSLSDIAPESIAAAIRDCNDFRADAGALLDEWESGQAGHDFWLTRCGHGAGFWDRGLESGDALKNLVGYDTKYPPLDLYVGDDGKVYGFGETFEPEALPESVPA